MKILFTFYVPSGGMDTLNRQRYQALKDRGVECHFLYQWPGPGLQNNLHDMPVYVTDEDRTIRAILEQHQFDAVIVSANYMMLERIRNCGYTKTVIFECQGLGTVEQATGTLLEALPYVHSCCQAVLCPKTNHMIQLFRSIYPGFRLYCFHNCLNTAAFTYQPQPRASAPIVGWVGRLEKNKNWRSFLRMAKNWTDHNSLLTIWMFTDANVYEEGERAAFDHIIEEYGFGSRLIQFFNVPHSEMAIKYSAIGDSGGFLCSSSITEGFGYALLEAMSCRCPVLSSDSDGPKSFIFHDATGKMYPVHDEAEGIQQGLEYLTNSAQRNHIRLKGQQYVQTHFSPEPYAQRFLTMLRELGVTSAT